MNDKARTIREQHCEAIRRTLQRILDNPAAGFETWFRKTTLASLPPPSRMTDRELSIARHTLARSRTQFLEEASMPTRQPSPAAFVPGGLQSLVDMIGRPAMYGDTEVLPKAAPAAATMAQGDPDAAFAQFCDRKGYPSDGAFDAALRRAFDAGRAAHPPADGALVDAKPVTWPGSYKLKANEKIFYSALAQTSDGLPVMTDCDQYGAWDVAMVFECDHRRPKHVWGFDDSASQPSTAPGDAVLAQAGMQGEAEHCEVPFEHAAQISTRKSCIAGFRSALAQRAASQDSERDAALLEKAAQTCDQQADGTNGPYRSACLQCADAVRALRDAAIVGQDVAKGGAA